VNGEPAASIVIPTRDRADYLDYSLATITPQAAEVGAEVIVVSDGPDPATAEVAERYGARWLALPEPRGANAGRNAGVAAAKAPVIIFVDDDIDAPGGWLRAMLEGIKANPDYEVFGGPIRARFEGGARACGRHPPITNLDLGTSERDADLVWSANMAVRRTALQRVGPFDETIHRRGDEEDWERRFIAAGGRIRYLPAAGLDHRRSAADSRLVRLARAEYRVGRAARRWDTRKGTAPPLRTDARWLVRWGLHTVRRGCPHGIVSAAHYVGRLREALAEGRRTPTAA
jgi:glycosyltransferase involved in cell wall biosynthesis